jgi:heat shock protein HtpX
VLGAWFSLQFSAESAKRMMGLQLVNESSHPAARWLVDTVGGLAQKANLPMPEVGVYSSPEWNAFATGPSPKRALVAVSSGILEGMPPDELEAVLAHEMSHVGNGDMVTMTLLQGVINAFVMFTARAVAFSMPRGTNDDGRQAPPFALIVWPLEILLGLAGSMITAWFSRHREYRADAGAASLTGADAMVGALERLEQASGRRDPRDSSALATLKIASPREFFGLLATHPPLQKRIQALQAAQLAGSSTAGLFGSSRL